MEKIPKADNDNHVRGGKKSYKLTFEVKVLDSKTLGWVKIPRVIKTSFQSREDAEKYAQNFVKNQPHPIDEKDQTLLSIEEE